MKLTPANARDAKPGAVLRDHDVKGLQLRCGAERKSWQFYYTTRDGIERRPTIGHFPDMSLSRARGVGQDLKDRIARGEDPSGDWMARREAPTVAELTTRYYEEWVKANNKPAWRQHVRIILDRYVIPGLGRKRVADVTPADVNTLLEAVRDRKYIAEDRKARDGKTSSPSHANHVRAVLSKMFRFAEEIGWVAYDYGSAPKFRNPVRYSMRNRVAKRKTRADAATLQRIAVALHKIALQHSEESTRGIQWRRKVACIWTLFLTGARVGEILHARTSELTAHGLIKTDHKTVRHIGDKLIPLPAAAWKLIRTLPPCPSGYVFGDITLKYLWQKIRTEAQCPELQLRDARRTFASYALSMGIPIGQVADVFGHTTPGMTFANYSFAFDESKQSVVESTAAEILKLSGPRAYASALKKRFRRVRRARWRPAATVSAKRIA